jgi:hypothetical protein
LGFPDRSGKEREIVKKALGAIVFLFTSSSLMPAPFEEWRLINFLDGKRGDADIVRIERGDGRTIIRDIAGDRLMSESVLDADGNPLVLRTFGPSGEVGAEVTVTEGRRIAARYGGAVKELASKDAVVLSDVGMFWVFSSWLAKDPSFSERTISIYQEDERRFQRMRLRNAGIETIRVGGRERRVYRLEMAIPDPLAKVFWPYTYLYWYSADDFRFLAYQGPLADKRISRVEAE